MSALPKQPSIYDDPLIEDIRRVKQAVSARAGHDVARLCRELREDQDRCGAKIIRRRPVSSKPTARR